MNKHLSADDTLRELWAIKDETAARFGSAAEYLAHLGLSNKTRAGQHAATQRLQDRLPGSKQASPRKSGRVRAA